MAGCSATLAYHTTHHYLSLLVSPSLHLLISTLRMVVSLTTVSLTVLWLGQMAGTISVRDTIITSLAAPQDLTVTSSKVSSLCRFSPPSS